ncbi:MAG: hypothetical protein ACXU8U_03185 [Asticcacaulis sp.]
MAFRYRKNTPGSGGARPGAGRRPDISAEERFIIGRACAAKYADYCASKGLRNWCDRIFEFWQVMLDNGQDPRWLIGTVREHYDLDWDELMFVFKVASMDQSLFNSSSDYTFDLKSHEAILGVISDSIYGFFQRPRLDYTPPRSQIAAIRNRVVDEVASELNYGQGSRGAKFRKVNLSKTFVMRCWNAYGLDERPN